MKRKLLSMFMLGAVTALVNNALAQVRYIDEVFSNVNKQSNVTYSTNQAVNLLFGNPAVPPQLSTSPLWSEDLVCDIYSPNGDSATNRPVIILAHTGSYLPAIVNNQVTGNKNDSAIVTIANSFAKRGYVVVALNYRLGWNPTTTIQEQATEQLIKATYRGIQDVKNCIRYIRSNATTLGVDTSKIIVGGQGTGGYISMALGSISERADIESNLKFLRGDASPMVSVDSLGDWNGLGGIPALNTPGNASISANAHMTFNYGGAMGDSAWIKSSTLPHVGIHCVGDIFAPFKTGNVVVPTTGVTVIPMASGAGDVIPILNRRGINNKLNRMLPNDNVTFAGLAYSNGVNNLFPIRTTFPIEGSPWEFWNRSAAQAITSVPYRGIPLPANGYLADSLSMRTNPFMTESRGRAYCDTIVRYIAPRIALQFNLAAEKELTAFDLIEPANNASVDIFDDETQTVTIRWNKSANVEGTPITYSWYVGLPESNIIINPLAAIEAGDDVDSLVLTMADIFNEMTNLGFGIDQPATVQWLIVAENETFVRPSASTRTITLTKRASVGIKENNISAFVNVYPNPAKDQLNIKMDKGLAAIARIDILDVTGRSILSLDGLNTHQHNVLLSSFGAGVYFANITNTNGAVATKKFIVQ
jgi:hypothetical protein